MKKILIGISFSLAVLGSALSLAQSSGGDFEITRHTIDNGGGTSTGGEFSLTGTIGQPDANAQSSVGGDYTLAGGFWARASAVLFKDGFEGN